MANVLRHFEDKTVISIADAFKKIGDWRAI
jgi:hypothetical protein